jgi:hypothetical protein
MDVSIRPATAADEPFLRAMLVEAAAWREREPAEVVLARPDVARYLDDWGRPGDVGVVADAGGSPPARRGRGASARTTPATASSRRTCRS